MELEIIQKTRDLCEYVLTITHKSPKEFRFSLISRLHEYVLSAMDNILRANELRLNIEKEALEREIVQRSAMTQFKLLGYMSEIAMKQLCILPRQYEQITMKLFECRNLLAGWMNGDRKRKSSCKK